MLQKLLKIPLFSNYLLLSYLVLSPFQQFHKIRRKHLPPFLAFVPFVHLLFSTSLTKSKELVWWRGSLSQRSGEWNEPGEQSQTHLGARGLENHGNTTHLRTCTHTHTHTHTHTPSCHPYLHALCCSLCLCLSLSLSLGSTQLRMKGAVMVSYSNPALVLNFYLCKLVKFLIVEAVLSQMCVTCSWEDAHSAKV